MQTTVVRLVAACLLITACSNSTSGPSRSTTTFPAVEETTTTAPTTTTSAPATTTTVDTNKSLINGLTVDDPSLMDRRVLAVKIDNHPRANPQSGLDSADMVIEVLVEGITRFITIWHESDVDYLGPMRSGRPTDPSLLRAMNEPTFAISGAQAWVQNLITSKDVNMIKELSAGTFRISGRSAPHNLYVDTFRLRETADERGYPDNPPNGPLWEFGPLPAGASPATSVNIDFSGNTVVWTWDADTGQWMRRAYGQQSEVRDQDGTRRNMGVPVMVALYVEQYTASPSGGQSGTPLPSSRTTGSGKAFVFADGSYVEGTWERESETEWFTITDTDGNIIPVPPGKIWVSLVPASRGLTIQE